jgi:hypothetical protein
MVEDSTAVEWGETDNSGTVRSVGIRLAREPILAAGDLAPAVTIHLMEPEARNMHKGFAAQRYARIA